MTYKLVIPVYNTPTDQLRECINSIKDQTNQILIIDDGSTLGSTKRYLVSLPYRVLTIEHGGISKAMNYAASIVDTDWIIKLDSDDRAENNLIRKLIDSINTIEADVIGSQLKTFGSIQGLISKHPNEITLEYARNEQDNWLMNHTGVAIKTSVIKEVPYRENRLGLAEDYEFWVNLLLAGKKLVNIPDILIQYRTTRTPRQVEEQRERNKDFIKFVRGKLNEFRSNN